MVMPEKNETTANTAMPHKTEKQVLVDCESLRNSVTAERFIGDVPNFERSRLHSLLLNILS